jgi:beta-glucanase (GH16 family)
VGYDTDMAFFTTHFRGGGGKPASKSKAWHDPDFAAGWHTPGLLRERNQLVWYVDGVPRHRVTNPAAIPTKPMTLLLTLAIGGGSWQAKPGGATRFPGTFDVDYVRAWQR